MPRRPNPRTSPAAPTIRTVATRAGVGVGTVSRVLNGGAVSRPARENVERVIAELGFTPHTAARGLATRTSGTVGLVVNSTRGSWFSELIAGVEQALQPSRRSVVIASLRLLGDYDTRVVQGWIEQRRVDGLLFVRSSRRERGLLQAAQTARVPIALIAPDEFADANVTVGCDNEQGGVLLAEYLADLGHRKFAFVGGPRGSRDTRNRLKGLKRVVAARGLKLPAGNIQFASSYYPEAANEYARQFLALPSSKRPTAVVIASDSLALGFMRTLLDAGVKVPEQVSVTGFDGLPEGDLCWPGLTTVLQPSRQMAREACDALLHNIDGAIAPRVRSYGVELVIRRSSGPPPPR